MRYSRLNYLLFITVLFFCFLVKNEVMNSASEGEHLSSLYDINDMLLFDDDHAFFNQESMEIEWGGFKGTYNENEKYLSLKGHPDMKSVESWLNNKESLDEYWVNQDITVENANGITTIDKSKIKKVNIGEVDFTNLQAEVVLLRYWFASQIDTDSQPCADDNEKKRNYFCSLEEVIGFDNFKDENKEGYDVIIDITGLFFGNQHITNIDLGSHLYLAFDDEVKKGNNTFCRTFGKMPQLEEVTIPIINLDDEVKFVETFLEDKKLQKISFRKAKRGSQYDKVKLNLKDSGLPQSKDRNTSTSFYKQSDSQWIMDSKQQDIMSNSGIIVSVPPSSNKIGALEWQPRGNDIEVISDIKKETETETKKNMGLYGYAAFSMSDRTIKSIKDDQGKELISKDQLYKNKKSDYPDFYIEDNQLYIKSTQLYTDQNKKEYRVEFEPTEGTPDITWHKMEGKYNFDEKKLTITGGEIDQGAILEEGVSLDDLNSFWEKEKITLKDSGGVISKSQIEKVEFENQIKTIPETLVSLNYMFASTNSKGDKVCNLKDQQDNYFCSLKEVKGLENIKTEDTKEDTEDNQISSYGVSVSNLFMNNSGIESVDLLQNNYLAVEENEKGGWDFVSDPLYVATFKGMDNLKKTGLAFRKDDRVSAIVFDDTFTDATKLQKINFHLYDEIEDPRVSFVNSGIAAPEDRSIEDDQSEFFKTEDSGWIDRDAEQAYSNEVLAEDDELSLITDDEEGESLDRDTISLEWQPRGQGISLRSTSGSLEETVDTIGLFSYAAFELPEGKTIEYIKTPDGEEIGVDDIKKMSSEELYWGYKNPPYYIDEDDDTLYIKSLKEYKDGLANAEYEIKFDREELEVPEDGSRLIKWNSMEGRYYEDTQTLKITGGKIYTPDRKSIVDDPIIDRQSESPILKNDVEKVIFTKELNASSNTSYIQLSNMFACEKDKDSFCNLEEVIGFDKISPDQGKEINIQGIFRNNPHISKVFLKKASNTYDSYDQSFQNMQNLTNVSISGQSKFPFLFLNLGEDTFEDDKKLNEIEIAFSGFTVSGLTRSTAYLLFEDAKLPKSTERAVDNGSFFKNEKSGWISEANKAAYTHKELSEDVIRPILTTKNILDTHKYFIMKWQPQGNNVVIDMNGEFKDSGDIGLYSYAEFDIPSGKEIVRIKDEKGSDIQLSKNPPKPGKVEPDAYVKGNKLYIKSLEKFDKKRSRKYTIYFKPVYQGTVNIIWNNMTGTYNFDTQHLSLTGGNIKQSSLNTKNKYWPEESIQVVNHDQTINKNEIKSVEFSETISLNNSLVYLNYMFAAQSSDDKVTVCNDEKEKKKYFCNLEELKGLEKLSNGKVVFQGFLKGNQRLQKLDLSTLNVSVDNSQPPFVEAFAQTYLKEISFPKKYLDKESPVALKQAFNEAVYLEKIILPKDFTYDFSNSSIPAASLRDTDGYSPFYNRIQSGWIDPNAEVAYTYVNLNSGTKLVQSSADHYELIWQPQGSDMTIMTNYEVELDEFKGLGQYSYAPVYLPDGKTINDIVAVNRGYGDKAELIEDWKKAKLIPGKPTPEVYIDQKQNVIYIKVLTEYEQKNNVFYEILFKEDEIEIPQEGNKSIQWNEMTGVYHEDTQTLYITDGNINQNIKGFPFDSFSNYWASQPVLDISDTEHHVISKSEIKHVYFTKKIPMSNHYFDEDVSQENVYLVNMFARTPVSSEKDLNKRPFAGKPVCDMDREKDKYFCNLESIFGLQYLTSSQPVNIYAMFAGNNKIKDLDLSKINTTLASFTEGSYLQGTVANMDHLETVTLSKRIDDPTYGMLLTNAFVDDKKLSTISIPYLGSGMHRVTFKNSGLPEPSDRDTDDDFYKSDKSGWINEKAKIAYDSALLNRDSGIYIMSQKDKKPTELTWQPQGAKVTVNITDKKGGSIAKESADNIGLYSYMKTELPSGKDIDWIKLNDKKVSFKNYKPDLTKEAPTAYVDQNYIYLKSESKIKENSYEVRVKNKPELKNLENSDSYIPKDKVYMPMSTGNNVIITKCAHVVLPQSIGENITCADNGDILIDGKKQEQGIAVSRLIDKPLNVTDLDGIQQTINTDALNGYVYIPQEVMEKNYESYLEFKHLGMTSYDTPATVKVSFKKTTEDIPMYQSDDIHQLGYISLHEENFLSFNMPYRDVTMTYEFDGKDGKNTQGNITLASQNYSLSSDQVNGYYFDQEDHESSPFTYEVVNKTKKIYHNKGEDLLTLTFNTQKSGKFSFNYSDTMYGYSDVNIVLPEVPLEIPDPIGISEKFDEVTEENRDALYLTYRQYIPYMNNNENISWTIKEKSSPLMTMNFSDTSIVIEDSNNNRYLAQDLFNIEDQEDQGILKLRDDLSYNQWYTVQIPLNFILGQDVTNLLDKKSTYSTSAYDVTLSQSPSDSDLSSKGDMNTKINFKAKYTQEYDGIPKDPEIQDKDIYLTQLYKSVNAIESVELFGNKMTYILVGSEPPADTPILLSDSTITYEYEKLEDNMKLSNSRRWKDTNKESIPNDFSYAPLYAENMESCSTFNDKCQKIKGIDTVSISKQGTTYIKNVFYDGNQWVHLSIKNNTEDSVSISLKDEDFLTLQGKNVDVNFEFYTIGLAKKNKGTRVKYRMKGYLPFNLGDGDRIILNPNQITDIYATQDDATQISYGGDNKKNLELKSLTLSPSRLYVLFNTKEIQLKGEGHISFKLPEKPLKVSYPKPIQTSPKKYDRINEENYNSLTMSVYQFIPYNPDLDTNQGIKVYYDEQNIMNNETLEVTDFIEDKTTSYSKLPENDSYYDVALSKTHNKYYEYQLPIKFPKETVNVTQLNRGYSNNEVQLTFGDTETFKMNTDVNFKSHVKIIVKLPVKSWGRWKRQTVFNNKNYYITQPFPREHVPDTYTYKGKTYVRSAALDIPDVIQYTDENRVFDYTSVTQSLKAPETMDFGYTKAGSSNLEPVKKPNPWILKNETNAPNNNWRVIVKQTQPFVNDKGEIICDIGQTCFKYKSNQYYNDLSIDQSLSLNYQDFENTGKNDGNYVWEAKWGSRGSKSHGLYFDPGDIPVNIPQKITYTSELEFRLNIAL